MTHLIPMYIRAYTVYGSTINTTMTSDVLNVLKWSSHLALLNALTYIMKSIYQVRQT